MIIGIAMVKDEEDVLDHLLAHMLGQGVDRIVVADNLSTDRTPEILHRWAQTAPVEVRADSDPGYRQGAKMTALAHSLDAEVGDWILPFDADEWWYSPQGPLSEVLPDLPCEVIKCWGWDHVPRRDDPDEPNPFRRMQWRREPTQKLPKVWFRYHPSISIHEGNHDVNAPGRREDATGCIHYRHFGLRTLEQFKRKGRQGKAAFDAAPEINPMHGTHWREWGVMTDEQFEAEWEQRLDEPAVYDPCPE